MACIHLQKLYQLCQEHELKIEVSSSDLVRIVCKECGAQDVCPTALRETREDDADRRESGAEK
ncbi:MAG: hypothetical protein KDA61_07990 [Planctomycetales bacterium]|nr:hypothetical protein [Planctomycetales bacterium]